jgi:hypothetical protein
MVLPGDGQIVARLEIHPEPCRGTQISRQAKGGVGDHAAASRDDLGQTIGRHIQIAGQLGYRQVPGGDFLTEIKSSIQVASASTRSLLCA